MDIEQLRLILDTVQSLGGEAKGVLLCWIAVSAVPSVERVLPGSHDGHRSPGPDSFRDADRQPR